MLQRRSQLHTREQDILDAKLRQDIALLQNALTSKRGHSPGRNAVDHSRGKSPGQRKLRPATVVEARGRKQTSQQRQRLPGSGRLRGRMSAAPWGQPQLVPLDALSTVPPSPGGMRDPSRFDIGISPFGEPVPLRATTPDVSRASQRGRAPPPLEMLPSHAEVSQCSPLGLHFDPLTTSVLKEHLRPARTFWQDAGSAQPENHLLLQEYERLREEKHELAEKLDDLLVGTIGEQKAAVKYREQAKSKDRKAREMEAIIAKERERGRLEQDRLQKNVEKLQTELVEVRAHLDHASKMLGLSEPLDQLRSRLRDAEDKNMLLTKQIRELTVGAFRSTADLKAMSAKNAQEIEQQMRKRDEDIAKIGAELHRATSEIGQVREVNAGLEKEYRWLLQEAERMQIRYEEKRKGVLRAVEQSERIVDTLTPEDREAYNFAKAFLVSSSISPVPAHIEQLAGPQLVVGQPGPCVAASGAAKEIDKLAMIVDSLRAEKDQLGQELGGLRRILKREGDIIADMKAVHLLDMNDTTTRLQQARSDCEKYLKIVGEREKRLKELQLEMPRRKQEAAMQRWAKPLLPADGLVSEAGFSGLTDLEMNSNALDVYITMGRIEDRALLEIPEQVGEGPITEDLLVTMVLVEFMHFDIGCSEEATGLQPRFDSLISFGPFAMDRVAMQHCMTGTLRFELQAFASTATSAHKIGRASLPISALLESSVTDPNPLITGWLSFESTSDSRLQIAAVRYKARWRAPIRGALEAFTASLVGDPATFARPGSTQQAPCPDATFQRQDQSAVVVARSELGQPAYGALQQPARTQEPLDRWARDVYRQISEVLRQRGQNAQQLFDRVAQGGQAQKMEFFALLTSLGIGLRQEQVETLWRLSDTNKNGLVSYTEFAQRLHEASSAAPQSSSYVLPRMPNESMPSQTAMKTAKLQRA